MSIIGVLILLHVIIPHSHQYLNTESSVIRSQTCTTDWLGNLKISLSMDHGSGHFEHYLDVKLDLPSPLFMAEIAPIRYPIRAGHFVPTNQPGIKQHGIPPEPLRGPPAIG